MTPEQEKELARKTRHLPSFVAVPAYSRGGDSAETARPALSEDTRRKLLALAIGGLT